MKKTNKYLYMLTALVSGCIVAIGCNENAEDDANSETQTAAVVAKIADGDASNAAEGCCGNCAGGEITETEGCCGKCGGESNALATSEGCCGKCAGETTASEISEDRCEGECNACAEGDSANCKCGDAPATQSTEGGSDKVSQVSGTHVNSMPEDRDLFHFLLENHDQITRNVTELKNGVTTVTESTDAEIAATIKEHVASMYNRVEDGRPLRMWDELYREIFKHADKINMELKKTENGISVTETSDDEYVVKLIQKHAKVVTGFTQRGFEEARENHEAPKN